jgi:hypothetical protein
MRVQSVCTNFSSKFLRSEKALAETIGFPARCFSLLFLLSILRTFTLYVPEGHIAGETDLGLFSYVVRPFFEKFVIFPH